MPHVTVLWFRALSMDHMMAHFADPRSHIAEFADALQLSANTTSRHILYTVFAKSQAKDGSQLRRLLNVYRR